MGLGQEIDGRHTVHDKYIEPQVGDDKHRWFGGWAPAKTPSDNRAFDQAVSQTAAAIQTGDIDNIKGALGKAFLAAGTDDKAWQSFSDKLNAKLAGAGLSVKIAETYRGQKAFEDPTNWEDRVDTDDRLKDQLTSNVSISIQKKDKPYSLNVGLDGHLDLDFGSVTVDEAKFQVDGSKDKSPGDVASEFKVNGAAPNYRSQYPEEGFAPGYATSRKLKDLPPVDATERAAIMKDAQETSAAIASGDGVNVKRSIADAFKDVGVNRDRWTEYVTDLNKILNPKGAIVELSPTLDLGIKMHAKGGLDGLDFTIKSEETPNASFLERVSTRTYDRLTNFDLPDTSPNKILKDISRGPDKRGIKDEAELAAMYRKIKTEQQKKQYWAEEKKSRDYAEFIGGADGVSVFYGRLRNAETDTTTNVRGE